MSKQSLTIDISDGMIDFNFDPPLTKTTEGLSVEAKALQGLARVAAGAAHEALVEVVHGAQAEVKAQLEDDAAND